MEEEVNRLNSLWSEDYVYRRRQSIEMVSPEEKLISWEENPVWKTLMTIYLGHGVDSLIDYFFKNLEFERFEQVDIILEFFCKITAAGRLPLKISSQNERLLIQEAQIERHRSRNDYYNMRFGKMLFGEAKFIRMVNNRV